MRSRFEHAGGGARCRAKPIMKRSMLFRTMIIALLSFFFVACQQKSSDTQDMTSTSESEVEQQAQTVAEEIKETAFEGELPCPDCDVRQVKLELKSQDPVYRMETIYVGKSDSVYTEDGRFVTQKGYETDKEATIYILNPDDPENRQAFLQSSADPNTLIQLNDDLSRLSENLPNELVRETR